MPPPPKNRVFTSNKSVLHNHQPGVIWSTIIGLTPSPPRTLKPNPRLEPGRYLMKKIQSIMFWLIRSKTNLTHANGHFAEKFTVVGHWSRPHSEVLIGWPSHVRRLAAQITWSMVWLTVLVTWGIGKRNSKWSTINVKLNQLQLEAKSKEFVV